MCEYWLQLLKDVFAVGNMVTVSETQEAFCICCCSVSYMQNELTINNTHTHKVGYNVEIISRVKLIHYQVRTTAQALNIGTNVMLLKF